MVSVYFLSLSNTLAFNFSLKTESRIVSSHFEHKEDAAGEEKGIGNEYRTKPAELLEQSEQHQAQQGEIFFNKCEGLQSHKSKIFFLTCL